MFIAFHSFIVQGDTVHAYCHPLLSVLFLMLWLNTTEVWYFKVANGYDQL